jgi:hypothetical protein
MKILSAVALAFASLAVQAQSTPTPTALERYKADAYFWQMMCTTAFNLAQSNASLGQPQDKQSDWQGCIADGQKAIKTDYAAALKTVRKKPAAEALKSVQVALMSALNGIAPDSEERKIVYVQRQGTLNSKVTEAWARFEVEQ